MTELKPTAQVAGLTRDNLRAIVTDMGLSPGWQATGDLYAWYVDMAREVGLEPITQNAFGRELTALGYRSSIQRKNGKMARCRFITARTFRP